MQPGYYYELAGQLVVLKEDFDRLKAENEAAAISNRALTDMVVTRDDRIAALERELAEAEGLLRQAHPHIRICEETLPVLDGIRAALDREKEE